MTDELLHSKIDKLLGNVKLASKNSNKNFELIFEKMGDLYERTMINQYMIENLMQKLEMSEDDFYKLRGEAQDKCQEYINEMRDILKSWNQDENSEGGER